MKYTVDATTAIQIAAMLGEAIKLIDRVTVDKMGGTPDLFDPEGGWDAFDADARSFLRRADGLIAQKDGHD